jgi:hypothetical protein
MAAMAAMLAIAAMAQYQCHCHGAKLWLKHLPKTRLRKVLGNFLTEIMIRMVRVAKQQTEASNSDNNKKMVMMMIIIIIMMMMVTEPITHFCDKHVLPLAEDVTGSVSRSEFHSLQALIEALAKSQALQTLATAVLGKLFGYGPTSISTSRGV